MRVMFDPLPGRVVDRVKRGLLQLHPSEFLVLRSVLKGGTGPVIAEELGLTARTVEQHVRRILAKCQCSNRHELMRAAFELADDAEVNAYLAGLPPKAMSVPRRLKKAGHAASRGGPRRRTPSR